MPIHEFLRIKQTAPRKAPFPVATPAGGSWFDGRPSQPFRRVLLKRGLFPAGLRKHQTKRVKAGCLGFSTKIGEPQLGNGRTRWQNLPVRPQNRRLSVPANPGGHARSSSHGRNPPPCLPRWDSRQGTLATDKDGGAISYRCTSETRAAKICPERQALQKAKRKSRETENGPCKGKRACWLRSCRCGCQ